MHGHYLTSKRQEIGSHLNRVPKTWRLGLANSIAWHAYLDQLFDTINSILTHPHDTILNSASMWDVEWLGSHVRILQKTAELWPFNLLEGLITGNNPFCDISLECFEVKPLFLAMGLAMKMRDQVIHTAFCCDYFANIDSKLSDTVSTCAR
jgi:hypothetical protein